MEKSLKITILLAILGSGVGHIYLGIIKRGIIIMVIGIALWYIVPLFVPFPYSWVFAGAYGIWQIVDAYKHYQKLNLGQSHVT